LLEGAEGGIARGQVPGAVAARATKKSSSPCGDGVRKKTPAWTATVGGSTHGAGKSRVGGQWPARKTLRAPGAGPFAEVKGGTPPARPDRPCRKNPTTRFSSRAGKNGGRFGAAPPGKRSKTGLFRGKPCGRLGAGRGPGGGRRTRGTRTGILVSKGLGDGGLPGGSFPLGNLGGGAGGKQLKPGLRWAAPSPRRHGSANEGENKGTEGGRLTGGSVKGLSDERSGGG